MAGGLWGLCLRHLVREAGLAGPQAECWGLTVAGDGGCGRRIWAQGGLGAAPVTAASLHGIGAGPVGQSAAAGAWGTRSGRSGAVGVTADVILPISAD